METLNDLLINTRVWSFGYKDHGPLEGPHINIPENTGGIISHYESRFGNDLIVVKWDNGQISKHYSKGLFSIGTYETLDDFKKVLASGINGKLVLGPEGGFRSFSIEVDCSGTYKQINVYDGDNMSWNIIKAILQNIGLIYDTEKLESQKKESRGLD